MSKFETCQKLEHEKAKEILEHPFVHYVGNQPQKAAEHFYGLREACPDLKGIGIFDHLERECPPGFNFLSQKSPSDSE